MKERFMRYPRWIYIIRCYTMGPLCISQNLTAARQVVLTNNENADYGYFAHYDVNLARRSRCSQWIAFIVMMYDKLNRHKM